MNFINKYLKPYNSKEEALKFNSAAELLAYAYLFQIGDKQEFWFVMLNENNIYGCIFEYFYEG